MKFEIIEDCSPFYIRYKHDGIEDVIGMCQTYKKMYVDQIKFKQLFMHVRLPEVKAVSVLDKVYKSEEFNFAKDRVSLFVTQPGYYYRPHRDGLNIKMGINYNIDIRDDKCVTSWYDFKSFEGRPIDTIGNRSREIGDYNREIEKDTILPIKTMVAKQGEAVLFNAGMFHDFDNSDSTNERTILTLRNRMVVPMDFFEARKILFNF